MRSWSRKDYSKLEDIPDGIYVAKITEVEEGVISKNSGKKMTVFTLQVKGYNRTVRYYVVEGLPWTASNYAKIGQCFSVPDNTTNPEDWCEHVGVISIKHVTAEDGKEFVNIEKLYTPEKGKQALFEFKQKQEAEAFRQGTLKDTVSEYSQDAPEESDSTPKKRTEGFTFGEPDPYSGTPDDPFGLGF